MKKDDYHVILIATDAITVKSFLLGVIEELLASGAFVSVICNRASTLKVDLNEQSINFVDLGLPRSWKRLLNPFYLVPILAKIRRLGRDFPKAKFYLNTPVASHISRLALIGLNVDVTYHVHGFRFHDKARKDKFLFYFFIEYVLSFFTGRYICINTYDVGMCRKYFRKPVRLIPGVGVDLGKLNFFKFNHLEENGKFVVGIVGTFNSEKGYSDVIELAKAIERHKSIIFRCFGAGDPTFLKAKVARLGLSNIQIKGFSNDILSEMCKFSVLLHPSKREGLPVSVMEAMGLGLPIIAADVRGCRDLITDGTNGRLYKNGDIMSLKNILIELCFNPDIRADLGKSAKVECFLKYDRRLLSAQIANELSGNKKHG